MKLRLFKCYYCGHKMRFRRLGCGKCHSTKLPYQTKRFYLISTICVGVGAAVLASV